MKKLLLSLLLITGCAAKNNFVMKNFESSNSMCIDALVINITNEGCPNLFHENFGSYAAVSCEDVSLGPWTAHEYYIHQTGTDLEKEGTAPLCVDMNVSIEFLKIAQ